MAGKNMFRQPKNAKILKILYLAKKGIQFRLESLTPYYGLEIFIRFFECSNYRKRGNEYLSFTL